LAAEAAGGTAVISIGGVDLRLVVTGDGLKRLDLPAGLMGLSGGRLYRAGVTAFGACGRCLVHVEAAAAMVEAVVNGMPPNVVPELDLEGVSGFDRSVYGAALLIPWGEVRTYGWLASSIGKGGAARAVGGALGRNPVPLAVPCHRVIRSDGSEGGFSAGPGLKAWLLEREASALRD